MEKMALHPIGELPGEILQEMMLFMDATCVYSFVVTCRKIFNIFSEASRDNLDRIRLAYLNHDEGNEFRSRGSRLIDLFGDRNGFMWTYDDFFQHCLGTFKCRTLEEEQSKNPGCYNRFVTNPDSYYLSFGEHVKRQVKIDGKLTEEIIKEKNQVDRDQVFYVDDAFRDKSSESNIYHWDRKFSEKIVRLFKKPNEATFEDFMNRLKKVVSSNVLLEVLVETIFEFNKTTTSKTRFILAGGFMLHVLTGCGCTDMDVFTIRNGESDSVIMKDLKTVLLRFENKMKDVPNFRYNVLKTNGTLNICPRMQHHKDRIDEMSSYPPKPIPEKQLSAQFILRSIESIEEIMVFFDIDCCRFCCDGVKVYTIMEGLRALKYKMNIIGREHIEKGMYYNRACKFGKRGFFTFFMDLHPLHHKMHFDPIVEGLRKEIETLIEEDHKDNGTIWGKRFGPASGFYYCREYRDVNKTKDLDESNYYSVILRSVNYETIQVFIDEGVEQALETLSIYYVDGKWLNTEEETTSGIPCHLYPKLLHHITKEDVHHFTTSLKQLLSTDQSHYFLEGYFESHLREKYNFFRCYICGEYSHHKESMKYIDPSGMNPKDFDKRHAMCCICSTLNEEKIDSLDSPDLLKEKVAIVTGGRIKIGLQIALIMLRHGATVVITTRFAFNAIEKFKSCKDYLEWCHRLVIYPLNLKDGKSVINFTDYIKNRFKRVHILINNAAQTVKRPIEYYKSLFKYETCCIRNEETQKDNSIIQEHQFNSNLIDSALTITTSNETNIGKELARKYFPKGEYDQFGEQLDNRPINSWNQKLPDVSITEIVESQMINSISPAILLSELFDIMKPTLDDMNSENPIDYNHSVLFGHSFIINVTSHEGQFETDGKSDSHIQTNISKASLNMLTRTCAEYYARNGILVNSVDTGWVSSAVPVYRAPPLTEKDAACRVLDPILTGSFKYGRLFNNYKEVDW